MEINEILGKCDHTLLSVTATWEEIKNLCDESVAYRTATVCIPPCYVEKAKKYTGGQLKICTVIGFPNGYSTTETKIFEAKDAIEKGADEIDMVINLCLLKSGDVKGVEDEIRAVKNACGDVCLKVIVEECLLTLDELVTMCRAVTDAGADYIKTSTGFSLRGASIDAVRLMRENVGANVKVKAAGGIKTLDDAEAFIKAGADRLGTSRVVKAVKESENKA